MIRNRARVTSADKRALPNFVGYFRFYNYVRMNFVFGKVIYNYLGVNKIKIEFNFENNF